MKNERSHDYPVRAANVLTAQYLLSVIPEMVPNSTDKTSSDNLRWMMNRIIEQCDIFPVDKQGRWIGFVQGVLALSGFLDVDKERDRSRLFYQEAYRQTGQTIPETQERPQILDSGLSFFPEVNFMIR